MLTWLTGTTAGKAVATFIISMAPVVELRGGLPSGIALGLDYPLALAMAVIGNMVPVPFIIVYIRKVFAWIRCHMQWLDDFVAWTGALAAVLLDMRLKKALPSIFLGVCIAAAIMTAVTYGVIHIF